MKAEPKTEAQLLEELVALRQQVVALQASASERKELLEAVRAVLAQ